MTLEVLFRQLHLRDQHSTLKPQEYTQVRIDTYIHGVLCLNSHPPPQRLAMPDHALVHVGFLVYNQCGGCCLDQVEHTGSGGQIRIR